MSKKQRLDQARVEREIAWCEKVLDDGFWKTVGLYGGIFFLIFTPLQFWVLAYPDYSTALQEKWPYYLLYGVVVGLVTGTVPYAYARWRYKRLKGKGQRA